MTKDVQGNPIGPKVTDSSGPYLFSSRRIHGGDHPPSGFRGTTPVRRSYSVKGVTKTAEVGSFGLIDAPSELAFTGGSQTRTVVQVASLILLAGPRSHRTNSAATHPLIRRRATALDTCWARCTQAEEVW